VFFLGTFDTRHLPGQAGTSGISYNQAMTDAHSMPLIVMILFLLVAARAGGELMERLGQPAMVGEIFAGIFLGPSFLNLARLTPEFRNSACSF
jgi:hypothetical protein